MLYLGCSPIKPLQETTAQIGSLGSSAVLGVAAGTIIYNTILSNSDASKKAKLVISGITGLLVCSLSLHKLDEIFNSMTPSGRFSTAHKIISFAEADSLVARNFHSESEFLKHAHARFGTQWPLIYAQKQLISLRTNVLNAVNLLALSYTESEHKSEYDDLPQRCQARQKKAYIALSIIEDHINWIRENKEYIFQKTVYEKHLENQLP